ncbi:MAG: translation initiation factor 1 [Candidatus Woesearchaeota archaeon]|nr:translation initiation factor 1 [Candidatus Woesearchaeota archaeon]MDN5327983.1 translation initiation factor 1 [Candidatus Woesearchaeota archaeon]
MSEICPVCGLPKELCVCGTIAKENLEIEVRVEKRKFGKVYTVVSGLDSKNLDIKELAKTLKSRLACGGTYTKDSIELQGDHKKQVRDILIEQGFSPESIKIR